MTIITNLLCMVGAFVAMECVANLMHRHVMHGFGWGWHRSHHEPPTGGWEKNDLYAVVFAAVAIALFYVDAMRLGPLFWIAAGVTIYGAAYAVMHDVLVHRRIPVRFRPRWRYLTRLIEAHRIHHAVKTREGALSFGFLYAAQPDALARELRAMRQARDAAERDAKAVT